MKRPLPGVSDLLQGEPQRTIIVGRIPVHDYIGKPDDPRLEELLERTASQSFEACWSWWMSPRSIGVSETVKAARLGYVRDAPARSARMLTMLLEQVRTRYSVSPAGTALDLGCGMGATLYELSRRYERALGVDPSLPFLVLAAKRLDEAQVSNTILIRATAHELPLRDGQMDLVVAVNVIEHLLELERPFAQVRRVLRPGGVFCADSRNRFDLFLPEPHVKLRWVGLIPRRWQRAYVALRGGHDYQGTRLLSKWELRRLAREHLSPSAEVTFARPSAYGHRGALDRIVGSVDRMALIGEGCLAIYPSHVLVARKEEA